jgi:hypothetical protein
MKIIIRIGEHRLEISEENLASINAAIADAPVGSSYHDEPIKANQRMQLVPELILRDAIVDLNKQPKG